jgi:hypothetical protein
MKHNKLHMILKIFGFLVFSIGILYICQFFTKTLEEGFTTTLPTECQEVQDSGRKIILCDSLTAGKAVFNLTNLSSILPGKNDNVCVGSVEFGTKYHTCFTRPGPPVYNDVYGIYRAFDPLVDNDTLPTDLLPSVDAFCTSYYTNALKINRGIVSTVAVLKVIRDTITGTSNYQNQIGALRVVHCENPTGSMVDSCSNIMVAYDSLINTPTFTKLITASNVVQTSLNDLSNISTKMYSIYNGSKCVALEG